MYLNGPVTLQNVTIRMSPYGCHQTLSVTISPCHHVDVTKRPYTRGLAALQKFILLELRARENAAGSQLESVKKQQKRITLKKKLESV